MKHSHFAPEMKRPFIEAVQSITPGVNPDRLQTAHIPTKPVALLSTLSTHQKQNGSATMRLSPHAERTGFLAEVGVYAAIGMTPDWIWGKITGSLYVGDSGVDFMGRDGIRVDIKGRYRRPSDTEDRFAISKTNAHRDACDAYLFSTVEDMANGVLVTILGWAYRLEAREWFRPTRKGPHEFYRVRWETLQRQGVGRPIETLV